MTALPTRDPFVEIIESHAQANRIAGRYSNVRALGEGFSAWVFEALDERTSEVVVLKFLQPHHAGNYRGECFKREARIGRLLLGKDNVVQLRAALDTETIPIQVSGTTAQYPLPFSFFALERARGTLGQFMFRPGKPRSLHRRLEVIRDVVKGVNRLHGAGFCHRDLQPENILLFSGGMAKISDFGTCRTLDGKDPLVPDYQEPVGHRMYAPPEMFCGAGNHPNCFLGADWFSVGAVLFEVVTSQNLYVSIGLQNPNQVMSAVKAEGGVDGYMRRAAEIAGSYPIPSTFDFLDRPWFSQTSPETHVALTRLIQSLCHFDFRRRETRFPRILSALDICVLRAGRDLRPRWP